MPTKVLVVEDQPDLRNAVCTFLTSRGYETLGVETCGATQEAFLRKQPDVVVLDYMLPDGNALDVLAFLKQRDPNVNVIIMTAYGAIDLAVSAIKAGATQFLVKPVELKTLQVLIDRCVEQKRTRHQLLATAGSQKQLPDPFVGKSKAILTLQREISRIAAVDLPVLLQGETGTGKTMLAKWIHLNGRRAAEPFVDFNCAGLSRELLESELFGHEKGAFTGATASKPGLLEVAHRGTVFLDEIGDADLQVQPKLLKVIEEKQFRRLGDVRDRAVDVRFVSASHHSLADLVKEAKFREDLYFRVSPITIKVPPLRQRKEDISALANVFLGAISRDVGRSDLTLTDDALDSMQNYDWPGNIRELRNVIERAVLLSSNIEISASDIQFERTASDRSVGWGAHLTLDELNAKYIEVVLKDTKGKVPEAAQRLGVSKSTLYSKIKEYRLNFANGER